MKARTLIVDDSGFFRRRIRDMLNADERIEVVGEAANGREAVAMARTLRPDVITMDIEMPEMDGITAVREIMRERPVPILMFSSLTYEGAQATLDALDAGAVDFLPKRFGDIAGDAAKVRALLQQRVRGLARRALHHGSALRRPLQTGRAIPASRDARPLERSGTIGTTSTAPASRVRAGHYHLLVIGTSTGGPVALQKVLTRLPADYPLPILLIQHMPASFTRAFAERLDEQCQIRVREAQDGEPLLPGHALLAPGGRHAGVRARAGRLYARVFEAGPGEFYKPSVDIAFTEAARACPGRVLGVVLTGMGTDGCEGAKLLKQTGSSVWSQDEATSVIYGMPAAVAKAGLSERVLPLDGIGSELARLR